MSLGEGGLDPFRDSGIGSSQQTHFLSTSTEFTAQHVPHVQLSLDGGALGFMPAAAKSKAFTAGAEIVDGPGAALVDAFGGLEKSKVGSSETGKALAAARASG